MKRHDSTETNPLTITRIAVVFYSESKKRWWVHKTYMDTPIGLQSAKESAKVGLEDEAGFKPTCQIVRLKAVEVIQ